MKTPNAFATFDVKDGAQKRDISPKLTRALNPQGNFLLSNKKSRKAGNKTVSF